MIYYNGLSYVGDLLFQDFCESCSFYYEDRDWGIQYCGEEPLKSIDECPKKIH